MRVFVKPFAKILIYFYELLESFPGKYDSNRATINN